LTKILLIMIGLPSGVWSCFLGIDGWPSRVPIDLHPPFVPAEPQMRGDHLHGRSGRLHRGPQCAARLQERPQSNARQRPRLDEPRRPRRQDGVAVLLLHHLQGRMEQHVHAELARDGVGLVDAARADAAHAELLQAHNIRLARRDHVGDPLRRQLAVHPDAAMHVVGEDARHVVRPGFAPVA
jgi:hypothetical protein